MREGLGVIGMQEASCDGVRASGLASMVVNVQASHWPGSTLTRLPVLSEIHRSSPRDIGGTAGNDKGRGSGSSCTFMN